MGNDQKVAVPGTSVRNEILQKIKEVTMLGKVPNTAIRESFIIESPFFRNEKFKFRRFGHLNTTSEKRFLCKLYTPKRMGRGQLDEHGQD